MDLTRFDPSNQKSQKFFTLMGSFWPKYIIFELKIYREVILHDTEEWCKIWRKTDLPVQNWHEDFDECWPGHSKIPNICTLMCCFWPKYRGKKYRGVIFDGSEDWCKNWTKTDLHFQKWYEEFGKFSQSEK